MFRIGDKKLKNGFNKYLEELKKEEKEVHLDSEQIKNIKGISSPLGLNLSINSEDIEDVVKKIEDIDKLPSYEEAQKLLLYFFLGEDFRDRPIRENCWNDFCSERGVHNVYNVEFINKMESEIGDLVEELDNSSGDPSIVEICAGRGKLSHQLGKGGSDIIATDDYSSGLSREDLVEKLSHKKALEEYEPEIVVGAWIPSDPEIGLDVLDSQSVRYFIDIGEGISGASWMQRNKVYDEIEERGEKCLEVFENRKRLEKIEKFSICRTDHPEGIYHSRVNLFHLKKY